MARFSMDSSETKAVLTAVGKAGKEGISLKDLESKTGIPYRVVHNITWRLEGSPKAGKRAHLDEWKLVRVNTGSGVLYALKAPGTPNQEFRGKYATGAERPKVETATA